ncbi:LacI family DNA-binding transcriptional regulator [Lacticaseibacillus manihotivorans]|nr:LacI family DNA-binding transcriptional regulator [Lacticaseibacillus manihotivorans]QFQ90016.1 LacI family DNA-binding transcriptional regulator [Lacticaseibacillus manihotivorans]
MALKMSDIAKMAQVSKSAVSIAINGKEGISDETRQKILKIIAEQGYTPLRKSRKAEEDGIGEVTFLVVTTSGLVQGDYRSLPFFNSLISALSADVSQLNGSLRTVTVQGDELADRIESVANSSDNGVLVLGTDLTQEQVLLIKQYVPNVVFLDTYFEDIIADFVTMDNYQGARLAGRYMLQQGYTDIGYFASDKLMSNFNERRRGFRVALAEADLRIAEEHFYYVSPGQSSSADFDLADLGPKLPAAIFCEDDYIAIRLLKAAQRAGIRVPEELAIMGFDDIYEGTLVSPELSTIHVPVDQMAQQALHQLQGQMHTTHWNPQKTLVATILVKRRSL